MKIDAHQHFWKYNPEEYGWINDQMIHLRRDFLPEDLEPVLHNLGFDGCVAVQARQSLEETRFLLDLADRFDIIKAVIGWVDLSAGTAEDQLQEFISRPKFKGVRHVIQDEQDERFILGSNFMRGIALLKEHHLTYDILVFPKHLPFVLTFLESFPHQPFVMDHLAKPDIAHQAKEPWRSLMMDIALHKNVMCKVSGMVTEAIWNQWKASDFTFYLDTVFEAFGEDRLMIGSDWPVCLLGADDYRQVMGIVIDYLSKLGPEAEKKVLGENAARFYAI